MRVIPMLALLAMTTVFASACDDDSDPCSGQTCSGHGDCVIDGSSPRCDCDDGYHASGLACLPEQPDADGDVDGDIDGDSDVDSDVDSDGDGDADGDVDGDGDADCTPGCLGDVCGPGEWATVCAGTFAMGSPDGELGREPIAEISETMHEVTLTRDFEILATEVTQDEFEMLMGYNPSEFPSCGGDCPVERVNWFEAAAYANALSATAGLAGCYDCVGTGRGVTCSPSATFATPYDCPGYRLPTEAEWEFAARAGTTTATYNGDLDVAEGCSFSSVLDPIGWYCGNSAASYEGAWPCVDWAGSPSCGPQTIAARAPNPYGLYDMLGNVKEWCNDRIEYDLGSAAVTDPFGATSVDSRVVRGSWWGAQPQRCRAAHRAATGPDAWYHSHGFRVARTLP